MAASFTNTFFIVFKCKEAEVWTSSKKFRNCLSDIHLVFYWVVIVSLTVTYTNFINIIKKNKFVWALKIQFVIVIVVVIAFFFFKFGCWLTLEISLIAEQFARWDVKILILILSELQAIKRMRGER